MLLKLPWRTWSCCTTLTSPWKFWLLLCTVDMILLGWSVLLFWSTSFSWVKPFSLGWSGRMSCQIFSRTDGRQLLRKLSGWKKSLSQGLSTLRSLFQQEGRSLCWNCSSDALSSAPPTQTPVKKSSQIHRICVDIDCLADEVEVKVKHAWLSMKTHLEFTVSVPSTRGVYIFEDLV